MPRHTPVLNINQNDIITLKNVIKSSQTDSSIYKRASVVLECANGTQGKIIAEKYKVTPNMVIDWRRKFEEGGVTELLSDAPRAGRRGNGSEPLEEKIRAAISKPHESGQNWTSVLLADHLGEKLNTVKVALNRMGISLERRRKWEIELPSGVEAQNIELAGVYLSSDTRILLLAISPAENPPMFSSGHFLTASSSTARLMQNISEKGEFALAQALNTVASVNRFSPENKKRKSTAPLDFIKQVNDAVTSFGAELFAIVSCPDSTQFLNGLPVRYNFAESVSAWHEIIKSWFAALGKEESATGEIIRGFEKWNRAVATADMEQFVWKANIPEKNHRNSSQNAQTNKEHPECSDTAVTANSAFCPEDGNIVTFTIEYVDSQNRKVSSTIALENGIPNLDSYKKAGNIDEYTNLVGVLEQGLDKGLKAVGKSFLQQISTC